MDRFNSDGVEIAYEAVGSGPPVLLIHGFASNGRVNWVNPGWVDGLTAAGFRVIFMDNRGHGESEKIYDPAAYPAASMAEDASRLLDHLGIEQAAVMGYSMGARISAFLTLHHPARVARVIFAGMAARLMTGVAGSDQIAAALEAPSLRDVADREGRMFRAFAEQTGSDLKALAACMRSGRARITADALAAIRVPVLVWAGDQDEIAGEVGTLTRIIPGAQGLVLNNRNHMNAVGDARAKQAVVDFLRDWRGQKG